MVNIHEAAKDIFWIGGSDRRLALFENLFPLPDGVTYNSYIVKDEKTVLFDTADVSVADQYFENLEAALEGKAPDYLVILHMEPDHCALISQVVKLYPNVTLVGGAKTFTLLGQFFPGLDGANKLVVKEGDTLSSGSHTFHFVAAPMVHWPEVLMAYDDATGALFSADAFGTFGAFEGSIFADDYDFASHYLADARRYYANIVGKYGPQVQAVLKKAAGLDIRCILPLHGPIWRENIAWFIDKYQKWSTCTPEHDDVILIYASLYGHTASAAEAAAVQIREKSGKNVFVYDVSKTHVSSLIAEIWRCGTIVLFCPTYNNGIYPPMHALLTDMQALAVKNRKFAIAQNGSWAPVSGKLIAEELSKLKDVTVLDNVLTIKSALTEKDADALDAFTTAVAQM